MMNELKQPTTRSQVFAQRAFTCIKNRTTNADANQKKEFARFTKRFPTLIHTCGLCQALAFAQAKQQNDYLEDIATVLNRKPVDNLLQMVPQVPVTDYMSLTREMINAASWLKRYAEALMDDDDDLKGDSHASMP
ncbi:MAG: type III-B CRISPR module-associated protein Cmr5 [Syntrophaceae bacterium]|nr:type III-B CRISPR module-associated protein Cmr5 [Syntrophaceae bacterium]